MWHLLFTITYYSIHIFLCIIFSFIACFSALLRAFQLYCVLFSFIAYFSALLRYFTHFRLIFQHNVIFFRRFSKILFILRLFYKNRPLIEIDHFRQKLPQFRAEPHKLVCLRA